MQNIAGVVVYIFLGLLTSVFLIFIDKLINKKNSKEEKNEEKQTQIIDKYLYFDHKFIIFSLIFSLFLIAAILLFAISSTFSKAQTEEISLITIFGITLFIGLLFSYGKNLLKWR